MPAQVNPETTRNGQIARRLPAALEVDGFAIASSFLSMGRVEEILAIIEKGEHRDGVSIRRGKDYARRNLLKNEPFIRELAISPEFIELMAPAFEATPFPVRAILFDKVPEANWFVPWHQDCAVPVKEKREAPGFENWTVKHGITHVDPPFGVLESMLTLRLHLDDCGMESGPLRVLPGTHRRGYWRASELDELLERATPTSCCAARGDVLLMKPLLLHASSKATSPNHRRVLHIEYADRPLPGGLEWNCC